MSVFIPTFPLPVLLWRARTEKDPDVTVKTREKKRRKVEKYYCIQCGHLITDDRARATIHGSHRHSGTNPVGLTYDIACFIEAPGAAQSGTATYEFTWFPGYKWRLAHCADCGFQLG